MLPTLPPFTRSVLHIYIRSIFYQCSIRTVSPDLLQVSDATGSMTMTKVSEKSPFAKELLVRDDCFILDNGANGKIFVWKGE